MLINNPNLATVVQFAADANRATELAKPFNATVLLTGTTSGGSSFTGSGVIYPIPPKEVAYESSQWKTSDTEFTVVITALHNLYIYNDETIPVNAQKHPTWPADNNILTRFQSGCKIKYGPAGIAYGVAPTSQAAIDHIVPLFIDNFDKPDKIISIPEDASEDGNAFQLVNLHGKTAADGSGGGGALDGISPVEPDNAWQHDVVLLISKDPGLYQHLTQHCDFMTAADVTLLSEGDYSAQPFIPAQLELTNPSYATNQPAFDRGTYNGLQCGYGQTSTRTNPTGGDLDKKGTIPLPATPKTYKSPVDLPTVANGRLQYKIATTTGKQTHVDFYNDAEDYTLLQKYGVFFDCDGGNNSSFSGDSGGPYLIVEPGNNPRVYLAGVNYGAGVAAGEGDAKGLWEFTNNAATSLEWFYGKLPDLRFQNV